MTAGNGMKVSVLHPDLGIGGAERLLVDACMALRACGHSLQLYTNHHEPSHSFRETRDGSLPVTRLGAWLPRHLLGRCRALCAYLRMAWAAIYLAFWVFPTDKPDIVLCDQISACIPFLRLSSHKFKIIFYCHYPDKLLTDRDGFFKRIYRRPLDWLEEVSTAMADKILVNSEFTAKVFAKAFPSIKFCPDVCYPSINTDSFEKAVVKPITDVVDIPPNTMMLLSINRYERKKNLPLALQSMAVLRNRLTQELWERVHLTMAGGYDPVNLENIEHYQELTELSSSLGLDDKVTFLKSPSDDDKMSLLFNCEAVIYTPSNEHFGIVPLEAMYFGKPVVAVNSGGPTETVVQNVTGYLCESDKESFAKSIEKIITEPDSNKKMGEAGRNRFKMRFSFEAFTDQLDSVVKSIQRTPVEASSSFKSD